MEYIIFVAAVLVVILGFFIAGVIEEQKKKKRFREKLYGSYGEPTDKTYPDGRLTTIKGYYKKLNKGFSIDDITWNDLEMDKVFHQMDYTYSAAGEEMLYASLRCPALSPEEASEKEKMITYFMEHEDERVKAQMLFASIGRTGKYSIFDYLSYLDVLEDRKNGKHYLMILLMVLSVVWCVIQPSTGILVLCILIVRNITAYFREKKIIAPYITTFAYLLRLLKSVDAFEKCQISILEHQVKEMKELQKGTKHFSKRSFLVTSMYQSSGGGNPLEIIMDYLKMCFHIDIIRFNNMLVQAKLLKDNFLRIFEITGSIETSISIGAYRKSLEYYCIPEFKSETGSSLAVSADAMYHPMLKEPVANSFREKKSMLLTGSNASGKSTFLKTVAINCILAQAIHTCMAKRYQANLFRVYSSMSLRDDLESADSYFIVEIKSLKRILQTISEEDAPVLSFVDEVLRGTNTVERIAASTEILKSLITNKSMCFAATHDIELTSLLEGTYDNYHFEETVLENDIQFNYKLLNGKATTRNAIKLLGVLGYDEEIINNANKRAEKFVKEGIWQV